jgi:hypothetical protein
MHGQKCEHANQAIAQWSAQPEFWTIYLTWANSLVTFKGGENLRQTWSAAVHFH